MACWSARMTWLRLLWTMALVVLLAIGGVWWFTHSQEAPNEAAILPAGCEDAAFEGVNYIACTVDPAKSHIALHLYDPAGKPWRSLNRLAEFQRGQGKPFTFAMNAGMYHEDISPVGLHVELGVELAPLNSGGGAGNFFMKPNGVFGITKDGKSFILDTVAYLNAAPDVAFATQSGPMLVIDGSVHPRFEPDGQSRFIRNGVGITEGRKLVFAISREPVSFGSFARLFRQHFNCLNALYFDGVVSAFSNGDSTLSGGGYPAGPIVSVTAQ